MNPNASYDDTLNPVSKMVDSDVATLNKLVSSHLLLELDHLH